VARKRIRRKPGNKVVLALRKTSGSTRSLAVPSTNELVTNFSSEVSTSSPNASPEKGTSNNNGLTVIDRDRDSAKVEILPRKKLHQKESIEAKRERKAAKTLAIITGICCQCRKCLSIHSAVISIILEIISLVPSESYFSFKLLNSLYWESVSMQFSIVVII